MRLKTVLYPTFQLLARLRQPRLAARLLAMSLAPLPGQPRWTGGAKPRYRVLVLNLNKPGFQEDIEESLLRDPEMEVLTWPAYALKALASVLLAPQLNNKRYQVDDPAIEASKLKYRQFLLAAWKQLDAIAPVDAVITANFGYFAQRELGAALGELGRPFIVLHKENVKSPARVKYWDGIYRTRGAFEGDKLLVYNATERDLQARTGIARTDQIVVAGMPRLDRTHRWRREHAGPQPERAPQLLFLSFWRKEKLTATERVTEARTRVDAGVEEWAKLTWTELCEGTHRAIVEIARQKPRARIVVKTKAYSRRVEEVLEILREAGEELPPNLTVLTGGDPIPLIVESRVVVGFNTTALLEALAAGKPVIVPHFAEAEDPHMQPLIIDLGPAVERARSPQELIGLASTYLDSPEVVPAELHPTASEALTLWVGNDDGRAGRRVLETVRAEIERSRSRSA